MTISNSTRGRSNKAAGKFFETIISNSCIWYSENGLAKIEKQQEPLRVLRSLGGGKFLCCFEGKSGVDYKGTLVGGRAVVFEAKHTDTHIFQRDRVQEWQLDYLIEHKNLGAEAFILLSYGLQGFYRIPVEDWYFMKNRFGKVSINEKDVQRYKVDFNGFTIKFLEGIVDEQNN